MDFAQQLATSFSSLPPEIATALIATLPVAELRGALPVALTIYDLPLWSAYFWSVVGNMVPVFFILWLIGPVSEWLSARFKLAKQFFNWLFDHTRRKTTDKIKLYGAIALVFFVAIPLPITGAWTGSLAAYLFGIKMRVAVPLIFLGVLIAGIIVSILTLGVKAVI